MCFESLPIEFDREGRATLIGDAGFGVGAAAPRRVSPKPPVAGPLRNVDLDPVTRVAGALAFHVSIDTASAVVADAHAEAVLFRGYEVILRGRNPLEAIDISSRACGVCGGVHSTCAAMALEMAFGAVPPPLAIVARNLAEAAELLYDHCLHLFLLAGPDYSEAVVREATPSLWRAAERAPARRASAHGLATIADIMRGLNPLRGALYQEAIAVTRTGREIVSLLYGKYPHPSAVVPAGLTITVDQDLLQQVLARITLLLDYVKRVPAIWEDLVEFLYEADERYRTMGSRPANLISIGIWDDPAAYDATFASANAWGLKRLSTPGAVVDGELKTTSLNAINAGIEEFVDHSFYEQWTDGTRSGGAPDGSAISPFHPWNKATVPRPEARSWKERYSWGTAPRWDRVPMESGPLARHWVTAQAGLVNTRFIGSGSGALEVLVPAQEAGEVTLRWQVPEVVNCLERNRARALHVPYCLMVAYEQLLSAMDLLDAGETAMSAPFTVRDGMGVGYWEAGRGALTHHCEIRDGKLANYQIVTPSTWMASPRDPWGGPGPYEEAVIGLRLLEEDVAAEPFTGIDVLRVIRSFDPCLPCTVHMHSPTGTISRDATTCACGAEA